MQQDAEKYNNSCIKAETENSRCNGLVEKRGRCSRKLQNGERTEIMLWTSFKCAIDLVNAWRPEKEKRWVKKQPFYTLPPDILV